MGVPSPDEWIDGIDVTKPLEPAMERDHVHALPREGPASYGQFKIGTFGLKISGARDLNPGHHDPEFNDNLSKHAAFGLSNSTFLRTGAESSRFEPFLRRITTRTPTPGLGSLEFGGRALPFVSRSNPNGVRPKLLRDALLTQM